MHVKSQILNLHSYNPGKSIELIKNEYGLNRVVKLSANENPFGCSPKVIEALQKVSEHFSMYPDGASEALSQKLAQKLNVRQEQLLFGCGGDEVIQIISRGLLEPKHNIVQAALTFSQYEHHAVIEGAEVRSVPLVNGVHDLQGMLKQIDEQTKIVWVCNPNNPTGTYINEAELERFLLAVPKSVYVVVDEAYVEYVTANDFPNTIELLKKFDNLIILRTFSKAYGLASFRVGYCIANEGLIAELNITRLPFNTTMVSQIAAVTALEDQDFITYCVGENRKGLEQYSSFCEKNGVQYFASQANFIFLMVEESREISEKLQSKGFLIRSFPEGIRITIGSAEDNAELINILKSII